MTGYCISITQEKRKTAGVKAPDDITKICADAGVTVFAMPELPKNHGKAFTRLWLLLFCTSYWRRLKRQVQKGDYIIYQHPMYGIRIAEKEIPAIQRKGVFCIALIHDLETLRKGIASLSEYDQKRSELGDMILLKHFDKVICHNEKMRQYLCENGFGEEQLVSLGIFDYLSDYSPAEREKGDKPSVAIAGNLHSGKSKYIYEIPDVNDDLTIHLYGVRFNESLQKHGMIYHGAFSPDELPAQLKGDYGLVWDGDTTGTCGGNTGEYLRYNDPHKTSLYLAAGMPVIVWTEAAIADFVLENQVGIAVEHLQALDKRLSEVTREQYREMQRNAIKISGKVRKGYFFLKAKDQCLAGRN